MIETLTECISINCLTLTMLKNVNETDYGKYI